MPEILPLLLLALLPIPEANAGHPWTEDVIYFALTDRFFDGDPANNIPERSDPALFDPSQEKTTSYHGGDFRGIEKALAAGYFNDLGITAIWLSPVVKNSWLGGAGVKNPITGYHGYWPQDFLDIDPHLVSPSPLGSETPYPPGAEGRLAHYRDLITLAHSKGIKIIQDVVLNHSGPNFFYDANSNGTFESNDRSEWIQPFRLEGKYENAVWADIPQWNLEPTQPDGPRNLLGTDISTTGILSKLSTYSRKGFNGGSLGITENDESITADFYSLRTFDTSPHSPHFDGLVDEFVEIHSFYLDTLGVDGLRIDTVKHVHHPFWDAFTSRLREKLGAAASEKILFGKVYDADAQTIGRYTYRSDWPESTDPCLDSVLDFGFCFAARDYLRHPGKNHGTAHKLEAALLRRTASIPGSRNYYNSSNSADGLNSQQKIITFIENHDGINRFRVSGITEARHRLAQALVLTLPGIPCIYYGAEFALEDRNGQVGHDSESGRLTFFNRRTGPSLAEVKTSPAFRDIAALTRLRAEIPALRTGNFIPLWVDGESPADDGLFAFARATPDGSDYAIVLINASGKTANATIGLPPSLKTAGRKLTAKHIFGPGQLPAGTFPADQAVPLTAPGNSLTVHLPSP